MLEFNIKTVMSYIRHNTSVPDFHTNFFDKTVDDYKEKLYQEMVKSVMAEKDHLKIIDDIEEESKRRVSRNKFF